MSFFVTHKFIRKNNYKVTQCSQKLYVQWLICEKQLEAISDMRQTVRI